MATNAATVKSSALCGFKDKSPSVTEGSLCFINVSEEHPFGGAPFLSPC